MKRKNKLLNCNLRKAKDKFATLETTVPKLSIDDIKFFVKHGLITIDDALSLSEDDIMNKLLRELHPYKIFFDEREGRWRTTIEDLSKLSGRRSVARKTKRDLELFLLQHYHVQLSEADMISISFKEAFEQAQENKLRHKKDKEALISAQNTAKKNASEYRRYFAGTDFELKAVDSITSEDIEEICTYNLERYDLRKKAFLSIRGIIKATLEFAYKKKWTDENAYHRVDFKELEDMLITETPIEIRVHSDAEVDAILTELHQKQLIRPSCSSYWALEMQILAGLRCGEIPPLEWKMDITENDIYIHRTQLEREDGLTIVNHTKTWKNRRFPIADDMRDFLIRLKDMHSTYYPDSPFLFPGETKNGTISNKAVYYVYQRICKKLGIEIIENVIRGPHSFRRNAISDAVNNSNGDLNLAAELYGNSVYTIKKNYYTGIDVERGKEVLNKRKLSVS